VTSEVHPPNGDPTFIYGRSLHPDLSLNRFSTSTIHHQALDVTLLRDLQTEMLNMSGARSGQNAFSGLFGRLGRFHLRNEFRLGRVRGFDGYAGVYEAMMSTGEPDVWNKVAVKRFRVFLENDEKFAKVSCIRCNRSDEGVDTLLVQSLKREVLIWKQLEFRVRYRNGWRMGRWIYT
jgi:hypothetical protein